MIGEIMEFRRLLKNRKLSSVELEDLQRRKLRAAIRNADKDSVLVHGISGRVGKVGHTNCGFH